MPQGKFVFHLSVVGWVMLAAGSELAAQERCAQNLAKAISSESSAKVAAKAVDAPDLGKAAAVIGHKLTPREFDALTKVNRQSPSDVYTAAEIAQQNRTLLKSGFTEAEVAALRREGVLSNSLLSLKNGAPTGVEIRGLPVSQLSSKHLDEITANHKLNYVMGENGTLYVSKQPLDFPKDKLVVIMNKGTAAGVTEETFLVREAGELGFNNSTKAVTFKPNYGFRTSEPEVRELVNNVSTINPGVRTTYQASSSIPHSRVMNCLDILSAQSSGKNFVLDRLISENAVTTTAILGSELVSSATGRTGRFSTDEGVKVIAADLVGGNVNTVIGSMVGKHLVLKNSNLVTSMAVRSGMGLGMIEIQKQVHGAALDESQQQTAEDIAAFNRAHFFARLPINHYFDQFVVNKLPQLIFDSCQRRPGLSVMVSPRAVRLYERYASATLYYGLREAFVGN